MIEGWKQVKLADYYTIHSGLSKPAEEFGFGYPFLSFSDIFWNYFVPEELSQLVNSTKKEQLSCSVKKGDVFLTRTSETIEELGMSCVALKDYPRATFNGFAKRLRPINNKDLDPKFIGFYLRSPQFRAEITAYSTLTTRASLNNGIIERLRINLPQLTIQRKISSILSAYEDLIENNLQRIKLLEEMAQQTYTEWFVRMKFPGHESVEWDEETGLPEGWGEIPIGNLVDFQSGFAFKSSTYIKNGKYKIVTIKNVQDGVFIPVVTDTVKEKPKNSKAYHELKTGDIIMSLTGNVGRVCLVYGDDYLLNQRVAKLSSKKDFYNSFIYCHFRNLHTLKILENISNGAAQQNLSPINTSNQKFIIPNDEFLCDFSKVVQPMIKSISLLNMHNLLLKEARDILLPRLMMGMIEV